MKKIFGFMILIGMVLALATAGGVDSGVIGIERVLLQSVLAAALISTGSFFMGRGAEA